MASNKLGSPSRHRRRHSEENITNKSKTKNLFTSVQSKKRPGSESDILEMPSESSLQHQDSIQLGYHQRPALAVKANMGRHIKPVYIWTELEVQKWLKRHAPRAFEKHSSKIIEHNITGRVLIALNDVKLSRMGIAESHIRDEMLTEILKLRLKNYMQCFKGLENAGMFEVIIEQYCDTRMDLSLGQEHVPVAANNDICEHLQKIGFKYSPFNVEGPGCKQDPALICFSGCSCITTNCDKETCTCNLDIYENFKLNISENVGPIYECNSMCKCGSSCQSRLVQNGVSKKLEFFECEHKGLCVRTSQEIEHGQFVCEYAGEVIDYDEAKKRTKLRSINNIEMNYIISVKEFYSENNTKVTYIDPKFIGNVGRFINHSCAPNLIMVPVRVDSVVPHLAMFALRDINTNEELTFHYGGGNGKSNFSSDLVNADTSRKKCFCGSDVCDAYLPFDSSSLTVK